MITTFKIFEKVERTFNVGDIVIYTRREPVTSYKTRRSYLPKTYDAKYGDECEITEVKGEKGALYVKAKNTKTGKYINKVLNEGGFISIRNQYGHWLEAKYFFKKPEVFSWDIFSAIQYENIEAVSEILREDNAIIYTHNIQSHSSPLICAGYSNNYDIIKLLVDAGSDWTAKNDQNNDFMHYISDDIKEKLIQDYPEKYENYLTEKEAEKYNL